MIFCGSPVLEIHIKTPHYPHGSITRLAISWTPTVWRNFLEAMLGATAKLVPCALVVLMGLALTTGASWKDLISSKGLSSPNLNIPIVGGVRSLGQAELTTAENINMVKAALDASRIKNYRYLNLAI